MHRLFAVVLVLMIGNGVAVAQQPQNLDGPARAWWSEQDAGWLGGLIGGSVGILGAIVGVVAGLGKARSFVLALAAVLVGFGIVLLAFGAFATAKGQPYHVYYPLFVIGGVLTFVMGFNYPMLKRRYDQLEFQNLRSMDS